MSPAISNNEIRFVRSLERKKTRDEHGMFVAEGTKMVQEAVDSSFEVVKCYKAEEIGKTAMERMTLLSSPSPALAVIRKPDGLEISDMEAFQLPEKGLFLALDGIRDPGNLGTILRIADWFGLDAVFASGDTVDIFNPKVVQSTMGAIFRVNFHYCDIPGLCKRVTREGGKAYGTFLDGETIYTTPLETGERKRTVVVIGNEANGISREVEASLSGRLYIPSFPPEDRGSESLNAAVATAVTIAEFRRRLFSTSLE